MIPTSHARRQYRSPLALCVTATALFLGLSLSGCVKSPRDILASWRGQKADVEEAAEESESIADASDADDSTATVSQSKTDPGLPQDEFGSENLLDKLLAREDAKTDRVTSDPFIGTDPVTETAREKSSEVVRKSETELRQRAATLEELLAKTKPSPNSADRPQTSVSKSDRLEAKSAQPKVENQFAPDFDSRLDQLKAELGSEVEKTAGDVDSFAEFMASRENEQTPVSSVSYERPSERTVTREALSTPEHPLKDATLSAKERVRGLLNQAHEDWESWKLEEAYRKTLAAQELAVLEGVEFDVSDERPSELAKRIANDIRKDSLSSAMATAESWTDEPVSGDDPFGEVASRTFESFAAGTPNIGWQAVASTTPETMDDQRVEQEPLIEASGARQNSSTNSGVNLLPPTSDDFPSEAEETSWSTSSSTDFTSTDHHSSTHRQIVNLAWSGENASSNGAASRHPGFNEGPSLVRYETDSFNPSDEIVQNTTDDMLSHVAANRDRVLHSDGPQLPALPAPDLNGLNRRTGEPVQVAVAPPVLLGGKDASSSAVVASQVAPVSQAANVDSSAGSVWYSRPLWFVGGLILLMLSMRFFSRRSLPPH